MKAGKMIASAAITAASIMLCSCGILPKEQEYDENLLVASYETEYEYAYVRRGTLAHTEKIVCAYTAVKSEDYSFDIGGEHYGGIYVKPGDHVKKGDLLAELDVSEYLKNIEAAEKEIKELDLTINDCRLEGDIAGKRQEVLITEKSDIGRITMESPKEARVQYDDEIRTAKTRTEVLKGWLEHWRAWVESRRIYAAFDGAVSYAKEFAPGSISIAGKKVVSIFDDSIALFTSSTPYAGYFAIGSEMTVTVDKNDYKVKVADPASYHIKASKNEVYFEIIGPVYELGAGSKGTTEITIEKREDVLYIPEEAVTTLDGQTVVFYRTKEGIRDYKKIKTGFSANGYVEVIDGLSEGESIISG